MLNSLLIFIASRSFGLVSPTIHSSPFITKLYVLDCPRIYISINCQIKLCFIILTPLIFLLTSILIKQVNQSLFLVFYYQSLNQYDLYDMVFLMFFINLHLINALILINLFHYSNYENFTIQNMVIQTYIFHLIIHQFLLIILQISFSLIFTIILMYLVMAFLLLVLAMFIILS